MGMSPMGPAEDLEGGFAAVGSLELSCPQKKPPGVAQVSEVTRRSCGAFYYHNHFD